MVWRERFSQSNHVVRKKKIYRERERERQRKREKERGRGEKGQSEMA